jgi:AraC-like DNA-binding protein
VAVASCSITLSILPRRTLAGKLHRPRIALPEKAKLQVRSATKAEAQLLLAALCLDEDYLGAVTAERRYQERAVPEACGTIWRNSFAAAPAVIVPDGCMDLLWLDQTLWVAGADTQARLFSPEQDGHLIGLRFWPGVLPQLLRTRADLLADNVLALDAIIGIEARRWQDTLAAAEDPAAALVNLAATVVAERTIDRRPVRVAAELGSGLPIAQVAAETGYSARQLQRLAGRWYGYGAKHLQRVLRLRRVDRLLAAGHSRAAAAAEAGYSDASHLWHDKQALDEPQLNEAQLSAAHRSTALPSGSRITA